MTGTQNAPLGESRLRSLEVNSAIDVRASVGGRQLPISISDADAAALASFGRTEDLALSGDGSLLVVAGFNSDKLHLVRLRIEADAVEVLDVRSVEVDGLERPHGVTFVDGDTLVVANREAELSLVRLGDGSRTRLSAEVLIDGSAHPPVRTPGSVATRRLGPDLVEVFVCNNYAHDVTRYVLDSRREWTIVDGERLLADGLEIPDGVAISNDGSWIAISNHNRHSVYLYRYDAALTAESRPDGVLSGMNYPHGLTFLGDDRRLVVVDAGLPYMCSFEAPDGDWSGEHVPRYIDRVMDDDTFNRGRYNPQEGGTKGVVAIGHDVVAVTSEFRPLVFFRSHPLADGRRNRRDLALPQSSPSKSPDVRVPLLRLAQRVDRVEAELDAAVRELQNNEHQRAQLVAEVEQERARLSAEVTHWRSLHEEVTGTLQRERDDARRCEAELARSRRQHADADVELQRLIERTATLERHIEAMHASRSWRWAAPLRAPSWLAARVRSILGR